MDEGTDIGDHLNILEEDQALSLLTALPPSYDTPVT